jgi:hypothetical protein
MSVVRDTLSGTNCQKCASKRGDVRQEALRPRVRPPRQTLARLSVTNQAQGSENPMSRKIPRLVPFDRALYKEFRNAQQPCLPRMFLAARSNPSTCLWQKQQLWGTESTRLVPCPWGCPGLVSPGHVEWSACPSGTGGSSPVLGQIQTLAALYRG